MMATERVDVIDQMAGVRRTHLSSLPAWIGGRDVVERRRVEGICNNILHPIAIAERPRERGAACLRLAKACPLQN
jgi:hypothetical protein